MSAHDDLIEAMVLTAVAHTWVGKQRCMCGWNGGSWTRHNAEMLLDAALAYRDKVGRPAIVDALVERGVLKQVGYAFLYDYTRTYVGAIFRTRSDKPDEVPVFVACDIEEE